MILLREHGIKMGGCGCSKCGVKRKSTGKKQHQKGQIKQQSRKEYDKDEKL